MICIYDAKATDFSTLGLGAIEPTECTITETAGGKFELEMVLPIADDGKWLYAIEGNIIKAPCAVRETPMVQIAGVTQQGTAQKITRSIYRVNTQRNNLHLRTGPGTSYTIIGRYKKGTEVKELESSGNWRHVVTLTDGAEGWMASGYLAYVRDVEDTIPGAEDKTDVIDRTIDAHQTRDQLFRITTIERDSEHMAVTATARHISYDLIGTIITAEYAPEGDAPKTAWDTITGNLSDAHGFTLISTVTDGEIEGDYTGKSIIEAICGKDDGFIAQTGAQLIRDNYDLFAIPDRTLDRGVVIRHGKNLLGAQMTKDASNVVTKIRPVGEKEDGSRLTVDAGYVVSDHYSDYPIPYTKEIKYDVRVVDKDADGEKTFGSEAEAKVKLTELAKKDFEDGIDLPEIELDVDFVAIQDTAEAANYARLNSVYLYDTVHVIATGAGINAALRVTEYEFDAIAKRYNRIKLGDVSDITETVYGYQLPDGTVSGTKLIGGSVDGAKLRNYSIQYAKIEQAAINQLHAGSISALEGRINDLTAETIDTDSLAAAIANIINLSAEKIKAGSVTADTISAALANLQVITAGSATFDAATVRHLISAALNVENTVSGEAFIKNLRVMYAQIVAATIGDLCIKASDGNYYRIDVITDDDGTVKVEATLTTVTEDEISQGHTDAGRVILATEITAEDLSAANIYATYALVNKIDAARIDVGQLFAQQAFIDQLNTTDIRSNSFIQMMVGDATVWRVEINSSNADVLTDGSSTTLSARVYQGAIERTDDIPAARFRWRRSGDDPDADAIWNAAHRSMKSVAISGGDVRYNAVYSCDVLDTVELLTSDENALLDANDNVLNVLEVG